MRFDWRLRDGVASPANFALLLSLLLVFPLILRFTGALTVANVDPRNPEHTRAFLRFCFVLTGFSWTIFVVAFAGVRNRGTITWRQLIGTEWRGITGIAIHLGVAVLALVAMVLIGSASAALLGPLQHESRAFQSMVAQTRIEAFAFLALALSAGYVEEFVFRGYIQRQCQALFGNMVLASVMQVAIFTSGHLYQGWFRLLPIMLIGVVLTITAIWRKSLMPGMIAHGFGDGLVSFMYFFKHL